MDSASEGSSTRSSVEQEPRTVFEWYAVRPPGARASRVCLSALSKRHVEVSASCLLFRRVHPFAASRECAPPPLAAFVEDPDDDAL